MKRIGMLSLAAVCACLLALPVSGAESEYCFSEDDFADSIKGICLKEIPEQGALMLGDRVLRPGDVLTADQAARMTFRGGNPGKEEISYLPVFEDRVEERETAVFSIRSRENQAPVAEDSAAETYKNIPGAGALRVRDPEEEELSYEIVRQPRRGTVVIEAGGSFTYTPKKNKVGVDSFTYTAADPAGNVSREATVTVTILKPSDAARYTDTANMTCSFAAEWMKNTGIFVGETVGDTCCFQPEKPVTRGEFLTMLLKALEIPPEEELEVSVGDIPRWLQPYAAAAIRSGIPVPEGKGLSEEIPRKEAADMVKNALNLEDIQTFAPAVLKETEEQALSPEDDSPLTRGACAELLYGAHLWKQAQ